MNSSNPVAADRRRLLRLAAGVTMVGGLATSLPGRAFTLPASVYDDTYSEPEFAYEKPAPQLAEPTLDNGRPAERRLRLVNAHTREKLDVVYMTRGHYIDESLESIAHLMRDHRAERERAMDRGLLDILSHIQVALDVDEPLRVLSGYRTPETNAALRKRSNGVARYSLHMEGKAADIHVPGVKTRELQAAALELGAGGVGYYGRSGFVHVDTGRVRRWGG